MGSAVQTLCAVPTPCVALARLLVAGGIVCLAFISATGVQAQQVAKPAAKSTAKAPVQNDIDGAQALLTAGKTEQAIGVLSSIIATGNLPPAKMARALYLRGAAYRQQSKPAQAISDLTSALWLNGGLSDADRADATQQRAAAYSEAGLSEQGQAIAAGSAKSRKAGVGAVEAPAKAANSGNIFAGLFGGTPAPAPEPAPAPAVAPRDKPAARAQVSSMQPSRPDVAAGEPATAHPTAAAKTIAMAHAPAPAVATAPPAAAAPTRVKAGGSFQSRLALVRTRAEAEAVIAKLKVQYASVLGAKMPELGEAAFGNMGSFYQVRVGPFGTSAEAQALCVKLKGSGLDCVPVSN